jgi:HTH-type transcriptional regulator/antitoxin HigA
MMGHLTTTALDPQAILQAWLPFKQLIGTTAIHTQVDYRQVKTTINRLLDAIGDDENHPLAEVLDYLADRIKSYEDEHFPIPKAEPQEVLRFLIDQHQLKQEDLLDCAPQSRISDILSGRRSVSKAIAKRLAQRFQVHADIFL